MNLDLGFATYDTREMESLFGWKRLYDYDPHSRSLEDAVGDHFAIYHSPKGGYFLNGRKRIQREHEGTVIDGQEYLQDIDSEMVCVYAVLHKDFSAIERLGLKDDAKSLAQKLWASHSNEPPKVTVARKEVAIEFKQIALELSESKAEYASDLAHDLDELEKCLSVGANRASLAMAGRILERCLKVFCEKMGLVVTDHAMIGQMIDRIEKSGQEQPTGLKEIWKLINLQRIGGVHTKDMVAGPSREQAMMVSYAVVDLVKRTVAAQAR